MRIEIKSFSQCKNIFNFKMHPNANCVLKYLILIKLQLQYGIVNSKDAAVRTIKKLKHVKRTQME